MRLTDRLGERYERLLVIARLPNASEKDTNARWQCKCDCGRLVAAYGQDLKRGKVKSCGCMNAERITTHGMSRTAIYGVWKSMHGRCNNPNQANYGGRGIKVCERWNSFENFYADMGDRPKGHTIERENNAEGYSKENCRWATTKEQAVNKRTSKVVTAFGRSQTMSEWAEETGIDWYTLRQRIERGGWPVEKALTYGVSPGKALKYRAEESI